MSTTPQAKRKSTRSSRVRSRVESRGVRSRFGMPVMDATEPMHLPLLKRDILKAKRKYLAYDVNDPENFSECVLATCWTNKVRGAQVLIMRRHAYVLLPGASHVLRYEIAPQSTEWVHLNDEGRFDEIPENITVKFRPPSKSRRLAAQRANSKARGHYASSRGSGRKQRNTDGLARIEGVWRHGTHARDVG